LRVGVVPDLPPYAWRAGGIWRGIEPDLARALAARLGVRVAFKACSPDDLLGALLDDQIDVAMAGLPMRGDIRARVDFAPPYLSSGLALAVRPQSLPALRTSKALQEAPLRLLVPPGSATEFAAAVLPRASLSPADSLPEALHAVDAGLSDAVLADAPTLRHLIRTHRLSLVLAPHLLDPADLAWAVRPGNTLLRAQLALALEAWTADGTLRALLSRHLPVSP
ncbi:MAG: transporter substrate-binding domain-containing protein, partial [Kiritimatiellae bacterium]|nr:transporter substrate-binding domain-containing protein [Kiritimatiellia bacterium]